MASGDYFSYSPSSIVSFFHGFAHYDLTFHSVSSDFEPTDRSYQEALAQYAIPIVFVAVLFFLFFILRACCCRAPQAEYHARHSWCSRVWLSVLLILSLASVALLFVGNMKTNDAVSDFTDDTSSTTTLINSILSACTDTATEASILSAQASDIVVPSKDDNIKTALVQGLNDYALQLNRVVSSMGDSLNVDRWNDDISNYNHIRYLVVMISSALLLALIFGTLSAIFCRTYCFLRLCYALLITACLCCLVAGAVEFSLTVGAADFCADPNTYINAQINNPDATYYIQCDGVVPFPFTTYFALAESQLAASYVAADQLAADTPQFANFSAELHSLNVSVFSIHGDLDCRAGLHQKYIKAVDTVCENGVIAILMTTAAHLATGLFFIFAIFSVRAVLPLFSPTRGYYMSPSINTERAPLLQSNPYGGAPRSKSAAV